MEPVPTHEQRLLDDFADIVSAAIVRRHEMTCDEIGIICHTLGIRVRLVERGVILVWSDSTNCTVAWAESGST